jgi:hypothetical protein
VARGALDARPIVDQALQDADQPRALTAAQTNAALAARGP